MKKKVMCVFGTRPEAIKMAPLVKAFQADSAHFETIVCVTGQYRQMLDQVLSLFEIVPDFDLNIMQAGQDLYDVTARVLTGMRDVFAKVVPDVVRDTTERPEALDAGTVKLVGTSFERITGEVSRLLDDADYYHAMSHAVNPYGDGKACPRILDALCR